MRILESRKSRISTNKYYSVDWNTNITNSQLHEIILAKDSVSGLLTVDVSSVQTTSYSATAEDPSVISSIQQRLDIWQLRAAPTRRHYKSRILSSIAIAIDRDNRYTDIVVTKNISRVDSARIERASIIKRKQLLQTLKHEVLLILSTKRRKFII